jgi:hypothetical protein
VKAKVSVAYCCSNHPAWIRNFWCGSCRSSTQRAWL